MKVLIIFALITLICSQNSQGIGTSVSYQCPDDKKIKIGEDVCAIQSSQYAKDLVQSITYIKKKSCGKNKDCSYYKSYFNKDTTLTYPGSSSTSTISDDIYTCKKKLRLLKIKKKCNYNAECYTGSCSGGKCATSDKCTSNNAKICGPDKYCKISSGSDGTCTDYVKEGAKVGSGESCAPGLGEFTDLDTSETTCKKYYSLDKGAKTKDPQFCKSYYSVDNKCAELVKVDTDCSITYNNGGNDTPVSASSGEGTYYQTVGTTKHCLYSTGKKELVDDLVKRYNKIKLDKLLDKENCDYSSGLLCDKKYAELYYVYYYYDTLKYLNLIKDNGEKNKDNKCEYEFWRTYTISSSYINVCFGFALALLSLLF